ncbi:hypothetical protein D3C77_559940 [compost metagenome]
MISGKVRIKLSSIFPEREVIFLLLILVAAQNANGIQIKVEINVPRTEIARVSSNPLSKSSPSGK